MSAEKVTAAQIVAALRAKHPSEKHQWAFFEELRTRPGSGSARTIDVFAFSTWESGGFRAIAYEVKVSRADFLREIIDPLKRAPFEKLAGECLFATPAGMLRPDEVPEGWGLIELRADGSLAIKKAPTQRKIDPWPFSFVACIARRKVEQPSKAPLSAWRYAGRDMTEDELAALVDEVARGRIEAAKVRGRNEARAEARRSVEHQLAEAVVDLCGWPAASVEGFRKWYDRHIIQRLPPDFLAQVRRARKELDDLLNTATVALLEVPEGAPAAPEEPPA